MLCILILSSLIIVQCVIRQIDGVGCGIEEFDPIVSGALGGGGSFVGDFVDSDGISGVGLDWWIIRSLSV